MVMEMVIDLPDDEDDHGGGSFLDPFRPSTLSHSISVAHSESDPYTTHTALCPTLETVSQCIKSELGVCPTFRNRI